MSDKTHASSSVRWARFRFQVVGPLFVEPPAPGADLGVTWTPGSPARGHSDREHVDT